jgi:glycosyltransferase involved in cell wall biosynthesis
VTIGTQGEGISDVIENGVDGFLVPADDADAVSSIALRCALDTEYAETISRRGIEKALNLTWQENACRNMLVFRNLTE